METITITKDEYDLFLNFKNRFGIQKGEIEKDDLKKRCLKISSLSENALREKWLSYEDETAFEFLQDEENLKKLLVK